MARSNGAGDEGLVVRAVTSAPETAAAPRVSILIRTKNEARNLGATLDRVFSQSVPPFEVFVIDSGSRDRTLEVAARYPVCILEIDPRRWSYSRALNLGARAASCEFLVCLSAHCPPVTHDWLATLLRHFDDPLVAAAWGPSIGREPLAAEPPTVQAPGSYNLENRKWGLENSNSILRRSLWLEFPFDESLPATEDKAWAREAMTRGFSLVYDPAAAVWHKRHPVANSFRRNRAVLAGFEGMFPELRGSSPVGARAVSLSIWRKLLWHAAHRDVRRLLWDLRKAPSVLAGIAGKMVPRRPGGGPS
ncbi:MAG: glycosyltransferase family 2 protein [Actinomycetota bacterium]